MWTWKLEASISPAASIGWVFDHWEGTAVGAYGNSSTTYTLNSSLNPWSYDTSGGGQLYEYESVETGSGNVEYYRIASMTAVFRRKTFSVTTSVSPAGSGTTSGDGIYEYEQTCTVTASAASGYVFVEWQDSDGGVVSTSATYSFEVTAPADLTAVFRHYTNLILRSATSGQILHGAGLTILRDS